MLKVLRYILSRIHLFVLTLIMVLLVEFLDRGGDVYGTLSWCYTHFYEFLLNYLVVFILFLFLSAIIGRTRPAFWVTTLLLFIVSLISGIKFKILGVPLLPWDVFLGGEATDMTQYLSGLFSSRLLIGLLVYLLVAFALLYKAPGFKAVLRWKEKVVFVILAVALGFTLYTDKPVKIKRALGISTIPWDQADNYKKNGFLLATAMNIDLVIVKKPEGYDEKRIDAILNRIERRTDIDNSLNPNIVVVLSEAFWDPTLIKEIKYNKDPLPTLHALQKKHVSGWMLSPQFGGGTANVEFEVLTGNTMRFLPQGSLAYIQYVNHEVDSLASILTRQGYTATAINPLYNWFFNSRAVYKNFGFSRFISSEFFDPETKKGLNLADSEVANKIIEESAKTEGPDFVFANTMENHWPYYKGKFKDADFKVAGNISEESREMLESYAQGITDADQMLKTLVDHYAASKEPTIVLFFGDHLPAMGDNYKVYRDTKYLQAADPKFMEKMFYTPFVIWSNYLPERKEELRVSPSYLGPYVLNMARKEGSFYTDFLLNQMKKYPIIPPKGKYAEMGIDENELKDYQYLQYDIMFGSRYAYRDILNRVLSKNYIMGYGDPVIESASPSSISSGQPFNAAGGKSVLVLKGLNFVPASTVYADGKKLETTYNRQAKTLSAIVPDKLYRKPGRLDIQIKIVDSKDVTIAKSNVFPVQIKK